MTKTSTNAWASAKGLCKESGLELHHYSYYLAKPQDPRRKERLISISAIDGMMDLPATDLPTAMLKDVQSH